MSGLHTFKIKSRTGYHKTDGYDIDDVIERVTNEWLNETLIPIHIITINTTPIYKTTDRGVIVQGVYITMIYKYYVFDTD